MAHRGIVVGYDGSESATNALLFAAAEAVLRNVVLTIAYVIDTPPWNVLAVGGPVAAVPNDPGLRRQQGAQQIIDRAEQLIAENSAQFAGGNPPRVESQVFFAAPVPTLVQLAKEAQLLVVGRRGKGRLRRVLLGSVSTGLIYHAHCPVAVIHDDAPLPAQPSELPVLVGVDGSLVSELATEIAFDAASRRGADLVAFHAWSDVEVIDYVEFDWTATLPDAEETLAERLAGFTERYPDVTVTRIVEPHQPTANLLRLAESAQLVVVGSHGRGGFAGMVLGSVSATVARVSRTPVIVARK